MRDEFGDRVLGMMPRLRAQAVALTRDRASADDLVQDAVLRALAARDSFAPGTDFAAWMRAILRNGFLTSLRRRRETVDIGDVPEGLLATPDGQESRLVLKELARAMGRLPPHEREALLMVAVLGLSYEAVAAATGTTAATAKTRVFRTRERLRTMLAGEADGPPRRAAPRGHGPSRPVPGPLPTAPVQR